MTWPEAVAYSFMALSGAAVCIAFLYFITKAPPVYHHPRIQLPKSEPLWHTKVEYRPETKKNDPT
jgi:hypothetical protein